MSDSLPPRVRVTLPEATPGRITSWQQDQDGQWWAEITVRAPAAAVQQVPGEDYTAVPRQPAPPRYVLATDTRITPPMMELHHAGCWAIAQPARWRRITPVAASVARGMPKFDDTTACEVCHPEP
jgi:hypothetical protein